MSGRPYAMSERHLANSVGLNGWRLHRYGIQVGNVVVRWRRTIDGAVDRSATLAAAWREHYKQRSKQ